MLESIQILEQEFDKYKEHTYMSARIAQYIQQLPNLFRGFKESYDQRLQRAEELSTDQEVFIQTFLKTHKFYYLSNAEKFFYYDEYRYKVISEDDILHLILTSISKDRQITPWKQKTKVSIMKTIKQHNLLKSIPNSDTIQMVLDVLCPAFFSRKSYAKYFLTIVGDSILKKNNNLFHFIMPKSKSFLRELNNYSQVFVGSSILQTFKYKYHEHAYTHCRMVNIQDTVKTEALWNPILQQYFLDILCVAVHYSTRFTSSDEYVEKYSNDEDLMDTVFVLKNTNEAKLINTFFVEYTQEVLDNDSVNLTTPVHSISWKNMLYLWKHYLDTKGLPYVIWQQNLKTIFINRTVTNINNTSEENTIVKMKYNADTDLFTNIYSKYIPFIQKFLLFWNENMVEDTSEFDFEIDEIHRLYKQWCKINGENVPIHEKQILDLISYYFPAVEIENDKFIYKTRCLLWDKQIDVQNALESMKASIKEQNTGIRDESGKNGSSPGLLQQISMYDVYEMYCKENRDRSSDNLIVSKNYFEKYIFENLSDYIVDNKFISIQWFIE